MKSFSVFVPKLLPRKEDFAPGHRACPGCGEALAVRQACKAFTKNTIVTTATGCLEIISSQIPQTSWKIPWIHTLFENIAAVASGIESAFKVRMRKGRYPARKIAVVAMAGDGGTSDIGLQALSGAFERGHNFTYLCYDNEAYMNCLGTSSLIMTEEGLKKITELKSGDRVYAFDRKTHRPVLKRCVGIFDNGKREVFELETPHHVIKATSNHPFLVLKRNGRGKKNGLIWKTLSELKAGDEIIVLKGLNGRRSFHFDFNPVKKGNPKVTHLDPVSLPRNSSPALMKYLGIWLEDGWVRSEKGEIGFALPKGSTERRTLIRLHRALFGGGVRTTDLYVYINSVNLARFIDSLGFGSGAKNKIIPAWIFTLPHGEKRAFVEGLMLSDGYRVGNSLRYVSASRELLRRLRLFLQIMGYRVGKIHWQERKKGRKCVERKLLKDTAFGYLCFSKRKNPNFKKYPSQYRYQNFLVGNDYFETEKIVKIKSAGIEPTLDLRVEDEHNFIADGIVVHNTGIQRSSATPYGARTTTSPPGEVSIGQHTWKKNMPQIAVAHDIPYVSTACPSYPFDLISKVKKGIEIEGPAYVHILSPCPTGWGYAPNLTVQVGRLAVETGVFPLYEVENGEYKLSVDFPKLRPVKDYLKLQGRFRHLSDKLIEKIQERVLKEYSKLKMRCKTIK